MIDDIQLPSAKTVRMTLIDMDAVHDSEQDIKVFATPFGVAIFAEGHGISGRSTGEGAPVLVNQRKGQLFVSIWADINSANPTHQISLSGARVSHAGGRGT